MNRIIKFRAWDVIKSKIISWEEMITNGWDLKILANRYIMQFIGLLDKNGKEIYEGDIVKEKYQVIISPEYGSWGLVGKGYPQANATFYDLVKDESFADSNCFAANKCEVIGNIYENPELLKKEEE